MSTALDGSTESHDIWRDFPFRQGDIVIATNPKSGTTWMQMICALLIFQTPELPAPLSELSPWLDNPAKAHREEIWARLSAQQHRRFVKTHSSLEQIPLNPQVTYIVVARHPLDARISKGHHIQNIDPEQLRLLEEDSGPGGASRQRYGLLSPPARRPPMNAVLLTWIARASDRNSLRFQMRFLRDAWHHRDEPNVTLVHYDDLCADLMGEMRRIADLLEISVPDRMWPDLVAAASFEEMRRRADQIIPDPELFKDAEAFFQRGKPGAWRKYLTDDEYAFYLARVAELAPPDLLAWLHREPAD
jgi:aryl sulfotransferase